MINLYKKSGTPGVDLSWVTPPAIDGTVDGNTRVQDCLNKSRFRCSWCEQSVSLIGVQQFDSHLNSIKHQDLLGKRRRVLEETSGLSSTSSSTPSSSSSSSTPSSHPNLFSFGFLSNSTGSQAQVQDRRNRLNQVQAGFFADSRLPVDGRDASVSTLVISRACIQHGISFNAMEQLLRSSDFVEAVMTMGSSGAPSRNTLAAYVAHNYELTREKVRGYIFETKRDEYFFLLFDETSRGSMEFSNVIVRFVSSHGAPSNLLLETILLTDERATAAVISNHVVSALEEFGLDIKRCVAVSTDNARVAKKAAVLLCEKHPHILLLTCLSHSVQLMLKSFLEETEQSGNHPPTFSKLRQLLLDIRKHFVGAGCNRLALARLDNTEQLGRAARTALCFVATRWNSMADAASYLSEKFDDLSQFFSHEAQHPHTPAGLRRINGIRSLLVDDEVQISLSAFVSVADDLVMVSKRAEGREQDASGLIRISSALRRFKVSLDCLCCEDDVVISEKMRVMLGATVYDTANAASLEALEDVKAALVNGARRALERFSKRVLISQRVLAFKNLLDPLVLARHAYSGELSVDLKIIGQPADRVRNHALDDIPVYFDFLSRKLTIPYPLDAFDVMAPHFLFHFDRRTYNVRIPNEWNSYIGLATSHFQAMGDASQDMMLDGPQYQFWNLNREQLPNLARMADIVLQLPLSTADVERSFKPLNEILRDDRKGRLNPETAQKELYLKAINLIK